MLDLERRRVEEHLARKLRRGACAERAVRILVGRGLDQRHELLHVCRGHVLVGQQDQAGAPGDADGLEALDRVVRQLGAHRGVHGEGGARTHQQCVAIGRRLGHGTRTDGGARPGAVVDDHALPQQVAHLLADQPAQHVGGATRRKRDHERDRLGRERTVLRHGGGPRSGPQGTYHGRQKQLLAVHGVLFKGQGIQGVVGTDSVGREGGMPVRWTGVGSVSHGPPAGPAHAAQNPGAAHRAPAARPWSTPDGWRWAALRPPPRGAARPGPHRCRSTCPGH